jgi:hypothetical protein
MRAALLPTTGNPFVVAHWLRNFALWRDEVDELVVVINSQAGDLAQAQRMVEAAGGKAVVLDIALGHGDAIKRLLDETSADLVVLCEEDAFVRHKGAVAAAFDRIEAGDIDVVGSPRGEDKDGDRFDWGPFDPTDPTEVRHTLWPAFLFARMSDLRATEQRFGDRVWKLGEMIAGLGACTPEMAAIVGVGPDRIHLETFAGTTFELRARDLRIDLVHHVRLADLAAARSWLADDPPWFHITGSTTMPHVWASIDPERLPDYAEGGGQWTRRVAWWERMVSGSSDPQRDGYLAQFAAFRDRIGIDPDAAASWAGIYDGWETFA